MIQLPLYLYPLAVEQVKEYLDKLELPASLATHHNLFQQCLQPNPRRIKRVLNIYLLISAIVDKDERLREVVDKAIFG